MVQKIFAPTPALQAYSAFHSSKFARVTPWSCARAIPQSNKRCHTVVIVAADRGSRPVKLNDAAKQPGLCDEPELAGSNSIRMQVHWLVAQKWNPSSAV